jgi:hypothetical protein
MELGERGKVKENDRAPILTRLFFCAHPFLVFIFFKNP